MAKKRGGDSVGDPKRLRVNVSIDAGLRKRFGAYASYHGYTEGQVIEAALAEKLRGFYVGQREPGASVSVPAAADGGEEPKLFAIRTG